MNITKTIKTAYVTAAIAGMLFTTIQPAWAADKEPDPQADLSACKSASDTDIAKRITSLNTFISRVKDKKNLTDDQKNQFVSDATADINGLNSLQSQIDNTTDASSCRNLRKQIYTQYRVYAVFLPREYDLVASDVLPVDDSKLTTVETKLANRIQRAANAGKDVSALQNVLSDMQGKLSAATTAYQPVAGMVSPLTPADYNSDPKGTAQTLVNAKTDIKNAVADLKAAIADAKQIRDGLKDLRGGKAAQPTNTQS